MSPTPYTISANRPMLRARVGACGGADCCDNWVMRPRATEESEPGFLPDHVLLVELLVGLGQVDDAFDQADDLTESAGHDRDDDADDTAGHVAEHEPVNPQAAKQNAKQAREHALVLPALRRRRRRG